MVNDEAHCERAVIVHLQFSHYDNVGPSVSRSSDFLQEAEKILIFVLNLLIFVPALSLPVVS